MILRLFLGYKGLSGLLPPSPWWWWWLVLSLAYCSVTRKQVLASFGFGSGRIWVPKFGFGRIWKSQIRCNPSYNTMMKFANNSRQLTVQKQDYERRFHITRALMGLPSSLCYAAWLVTIVPVKLRGCRHHSIRVRRRNGGAEMSQRRNGGAEMSSSAVFIQ